MRASRRDIKRIAAAIKANADHGSTTQLAADIAAVLEEGNTVTTFDKAAFMQACGVEYQRPFREVFRERYGGD